MSDNTYPPIGVETPLPLISPQEFKDFGYLQEVNRLFFHPLGLALQITTEDDGSSHYGVLDVRADPEGMLFATCATDEEWERMKQKAERIGWEWEGRGQRRLAKGLDRIQSIESARPISPGIELRLSNLMDASDATLNGDSDAV